MKECPLFLLCSPVFAVAGRIAGRGAFWHEWRIGRRLPGRGRVLVKLDQDAPALKHLGRMLP